MRIANIIMPVLIATLANLAVDAMAGEEIYRWVDENGVVHFSSEPPQNTSAEQITIQQDKIPAPTSSSASDATAGDTLAEPELSPAEQERAAREKKRTEMQEQKKAIAAACEQNKKIVAQLEPSTRVMVQNEDGTVSRMDDNVRLETLDKAKTYIAENCDK